MCRTWRSRKEESAGSKVSRLQLQPVRRSSARLRERLSIGSKARGRETTRRAKGVSIETTIAELAPYMRGWCSYFGFCETPEALVYLTRWVRLRLRATLWRQVENTTPSSRGAVGTRGPSATGQPYSWKRSWPLVPRPDKGPFGGPLQRVLHIARTSDVDRGVLA
jgi:hypothetical protein